MAWTEHVAGVLWSQPAEEDSLSVKLAELGAAHDEPVVAGYATKRFLPGVDASGQPVILMADGQDNFTFFRPRSA